MKLESARKSLERRKEATRSNESALVSHMVPRIIKENRTENSTSEIVKEFDDTVAGPSMLIRDQHILDVSVRLNDQCIVSMIVLSIYLMILVRTMSLFSSRFAILSSKYSTIALEMRFCTFLYFVTSTSLERSCLACSRPLGSESVSSVACLLSCQY